jgi:hypothetical protein
MNPLATVTPRSQNSFAANVCHRLPTRLRLEVPALRVGTKSNLGGTLFDSRIAEPLERFTAAIAGVTHVRANPLTGSLLIEHDGAPGREATILATLQVVLPPVDPEPPRVLRDLYRTATALDQATLRASDGWIDLKTILAGLLGIYGLSQLLTERPFRPPSSLTMIWWAYTNLRLVAREQNMRRSR